MTSDEPLIGPHDVAALFGVPVSWVYARAEDKTLPAFKVGKYLRFSRSEILAWRERQRVERALAPLRAAR